ncbi:A-kinase anchor protein 7-like [Hydractinia symbiolongicarpus]|uniref:A-kinase anchor protein 7-like n=1 Tax=Hydractinia symbiolongicarpus TaxID=13093 RepID=UPI00254E63F6|nr:A-kinase anchor protein 7-like [Hydractinia symbiolongicarpus]
MDTVSSTVKDSAQVNFVDDDESFHISKLFEAGESTNGDKSIKQNKKKNGKDKGNDEKKRLPNYFLAIRIYNQEIHEKLSALQETIKSINADFVHSFVNVSTLHVTLNVLSLNDLLEIENAINALHLATQKVSEIVKEYTERTLEFEGLGDFRGQVVFVKLKHNNTVKFIEKLVDVFKNSFKELKVHYPANEKFTPHLTVMKLSKCFKLMKKKGIKRIPQKMYKASKDSHFGFDEIKDVLLCSMTDKKDSNGFYKVVASVNLDTMKVAKHVSNEDLDVVSLSTWNVVERDISVTEDIEASWHIVDEDEIKEAKNAVDNKSFNFSNDMEKKNDK